MCITHSKLSNIAQVFTTKIDYKLSKRDYDRIIKWVKNMLPEGNSLNILLDEEINVDATKFFEFLKYSSEPLWDRCITHSKLSNIAQVFTTKIDYKLSKRDYDRIIKWVKNMLPEGNSLKYNFFMVKFMMKPLVIGTKKLICVQTFAC
jgi:Holliday junction resolvase RusA-like endonuclease